MGSILLLLHTHLSCEAAKAAKSVQVEHEYDSKAVRNHVAGIRPREGFFDESIWDGRFKRWRANPLDEVDMSDISYLYQFVHVFVGHLSTFVADNRLC